MKTLKVDCYGEQFDVAFHKDTYANNNATYIGALVIENGMVDDHYGDVTTNIPGTSLKENEVILDTNNSGSLINTMMSAGLLKDTGRFAFSGWCTYPIATVNNDKLAQYMYEG